jgi:thioredoxin reductase
MKLLLPNWIDDLTWADSATVTSVETEGDGILVTFDDTRTEHFDRAFAHQSFEQRTALSNALGCARTEDGSLELDAMNQTSVPGVFSAGDQASAGMQVNIAVGSGHAAGVGAMFALVAGVQG